MIINILISLILTLLIETTVFLIIALLRDYDEKNFSNNRIVIASICASTLTLPVLHIIIFMGGFGLAGILLGEIIVTLVEAYMYKRYFHIHFSQAFLISISANTTSFLFGLYFF